MLEFMKRAEKDVTKCQDETTKCKVAFEKMIKYYGVKLDHSSDAKIPGQFFLTWCAFAKDFYDIWSAETVR